MSCSPPSLRPRSSDRGLTNLWVAALVLLGFFVAWAVVSLLLLVLLPAA